jgi:replicative DNA helicase
VNELQPPFNIDIEMAVLGNLLSSSMLIGEVARLVDAADFYREVHQTIYSMLLALYDQGKPTDALYVSEVLERRGITDIFDRSPFGYLTHMMNREPMSVRVEGHARRVAQLAERRRLGNVASQLVELAYSDDDDAVEQAESLVLSVKRTRTQQAFVSIGDYLPLYLDHLHEVETSKVRGIPTGFTDLDSVLSGLHRGDLYIPAARPRVGKTTLVQNFAYNAAKKYGKRTAFFSLEMSLESLMDRFISMHTHIDTQRLRNGRLTSDDKGKLYDAQSYAALEEMGIYLNYTPGISIEALKSEARRMVSKHAIDLIVVDYLQLVKGTIGGKRVMTRELEVAEVARELKALAGELHVPVIAPAQINREIEHRPASRVEGEPLTFKLPVLADLRESGELEQSADVVIFIARSEEKQARIKLIVAKHRNGPEGEIDLYFKGEEMTFYSLEGARA